MSIAWVFPGQGSQAVGMGSDLYEQIPGARAIFDQADETLGIPISQLCFEGPEAELTATENAQPALLTVSTALMRALEDLGGAGLARPIAVARTIWSRSANRSAPTQSRAWQPGSWWWQTTTPPTSW
ncbi:ACP S-malonyltransferase [Oscillochloris sp. ZM17-4]|uniref:ACP S-malonyltransferase n=1 Tax=Oscillochloris sp. ZM17-4 TaxID=2866714 RepID=UPI00210323C5|nr:acyltransferase domain-containing protein [Oscillochloris sp. ZM17-4]